MSYNYQFIIVIYVQKIYIPINSINISKEKSCLKYISEMLNKY